MSYNAGMKVEIEMEAWASNPDLDFDILKQKVLDAGNVILREEPENGRLLIGYVKEPLLKMERPDQSNG